MDLIISWEVVYCRGTRMVVDASLAVVSADGLKFYNETELKAWFNAWDYFRQL